MTQDNCFEDPVNLFIPGEHLGNCTDWIKLNTNEYAYPPSPYVTQALTEAVHNPSILKRYPEPNSSQLTQALAQYHGVPLAQVLASCGTETLIRCACLADIQKPKLVAYFWPTYSLYAHILSIEHIEHISIPLDKHMQWDIQSLLDSKATVLVVTAPHAPTGTLYQLDQIIELLTHFSGTVILDEAYASFAPTTALSLLEQFPQLILIRTFSKQFGLAGMRIAYMLASPAWIQKVKNLHPHYAISQLSQLAACAALEDTEYYHRTHIRILQSRSKLQDHLQILGWHTYESHGNYILTQPQKLQMPPGPETSNALYQTLKDQKILIRIFPKCPMLNTYIRITIGTETEMTTVHKALDAWFIY